MRMENVITSLKRFFQDPDVESIKLDVDMDPDIKKKGLMNFMSMVDKEQRKGNLTLVMVRNKKTTTEKKKPKRTVKRVNNYNKKGECEIDTSIEYPNQ